MSEIANRGGRKKTGIYFGPFTLIYDYSKVLTGFSKCCVVYKSLGYSP